MIDYIGLAQTYGGYTNLDRQYLKSILTGLSHDEKLRLITPPPSVINAYFAEIYQKQSPKAATDYYYQLTQALELYQENPSFTEVKPFIRLNLKGQSFGFAYAKGAEVATVFAEKETPIEESLFFALAQIFPQYHIYQEKNKIRMKEMSFCQDGLQEIPVQQGLLSRVFKNQGFTMIKGYNADEISEIANLYPGNRVYHFEQRQFTIYQLP